MLAISAALGLPCQVPDQLRAHCQPWTDVRGWAAAEHNRRSLWQVGDREAPGSPQDDEPEQKFNHVEFLGSPVLSLVTTGSGLKCQRVNGGSGDGTGTGAPRPVRPELCPLTFRRTSIECGQSGGKIGTGSSGDICERRQCSFRFLRICNRER